MINELTSQMTHVDLQRGGQPRRGEQKRATPEELKEAALTEIHQFYSRQHIRNGLRFEEQNDEQRMDKGELHAFCRDFGLHLPKSHIHRLFKRVQSNLKPLELPQFKAILPHIGLQFARLKSREIRFRLKELKDVLEYPSNRELGV
mmetsp:Transcript_5637/g.8904  ORF Transcript_5637/g.8904 Transcript_5637/m.8904 type:complete len:146 (-) Transcript_5637:1807-2244(-)